MKTEYQEPNMEIFMLDKTPRTIVEASDEFGSGTDMVF